MLLTKQHKESNVEIFSVLLISRHNTGFTDAVVCGSMDRS